MLARDIPFCQLRFSLTGETLFARDARGSLHRFLLRENPAALNDQTLYALSRRKPTKSTPSSQDLVAARHALEAVGGECLGAANVGKGSVAAL